MEKTGELMAYWLTGFFNPTGFLTAVKQKITRLEGWSLDKVQIISQVQTKTMVKTLDEVRGTIT